MTRLSYIRLLSLVGGGEHALSGHYIVSYDADYHLPDGSYDGGRLITTPDRDQAGLFPMDEAVRLLYSSPQCDCHRKRADGKPNKPLTAFVAEITGEEPHDE